MMAMRMMMTVKAPVMVMFVMPVPDDDDCGAGRGIDRRRETKARQGQERKSQQFFHSVIGLSSRYFHVFIGCWCECKVLIILIHRF